jgi:hypothetical protein
MIANNASVLACMVASWLFAAAAAHAASPQSIGGAIQLLRPEGAVTPGEGLLSEAAPAVVASPGGGFVVGWHQWDSLGHRLLARLISNRGEAGVGIEFKRLFDERDSPDLLRLVRLSNGVVAVWEQFVFHVGSFVDAQQIMGTDGVLGKVGELSSIRFGTTGACLEVSGFENTAQIYGQFLVGDEDVEILHASVLLVPGQLVYAPAKGLVSLSREWLERGDLPCPAFETRASAWWTFERQTPTLHFQNFALGREFSLMDLEPPVTLHAIERGHLLAARHGSGLRVYRAEPARDALVAVGESAAGDRILAAAPDGRMMVARRAANGLEIRFLAKDLEVVGAAFVIPSPHATATFDDSGTRVLVAWTAENNVTRPNGGNVTPVAARLFEWVP